MNLRDLTRDKHNLAESSRFAKYLISGNITPSIYAQYLYNQYFCYWYLEKRATNLGVLDGIETIKRSHKILHDLIELNVDDELFKCKSTLDYCSYVENLNPEQLIAHIYVRHFGDMFGGAMIKKKIPGEGTMYDFENKQELIAAVRSKLTPEMASEANKVFDYAIRLFEELSNEHNISTTN